VLTNIAKVNPDTEGFPDFSAGAIYTGPTWPCGVVNRAYIQPSHSGAIQAFFPPQPFDAEERRPLAAFGAASSLCGGHWQFLKQLV
jgi:hypothetical protein